MFLEMRKDTLIDGSGSEYSVMFFVHYALLVVLLLGGYSYERLRGQWYKEDCQLAMEMKDIISKIVGLQEKIRDIRGRYTKMSDLARVQAHHNRRR